MIKKATDVDHRRPFFIDLICFRLLEYYIIESSVFYQTNIQFITA